MPIDVTCDECGDTYQTYPSKLKNRKNTFCSKPCHDAFQSHSTPTGSDHPNYKSITFECDNCGIEAEQPPSQYDLCTYHFCGMPCKAEWQKAYMRGPNNPSYTGSRVTTSCEQCGTSVEVSAGRYEIRQNIFCDHDCYGKWREGRFAGPESPSWKGGPVKYYGPNWYAQRHRARKRDDYTCQNCGVTEEQYGRELDVHHIKPFREFGYVPEENEAYLRANKLSNLTCLCVICHITLERSLTPQAIQLKLSLT